MPAKKTKTSVPPPPKKGMVEEPINPVNLLEIILSDHNILNSFLIKFLLKIKSLYVVFRFTEEKMYIYACTSSGNTKTVALLDGTKCDSYFCEEEGTAILLYSDISKVFKILDSSFSVAKICYDGPGVNGVKTFKFIFEDHESKKDCTLKIKAKNVVEDKELLKIHKYMDISYLDSAELKFSLPSKSLCKTIGDINKLNKEYKKMTIEKIRSNTSKLNIKYNHNGFEYCEVYKNSESIELKTDTTKTFSCDIGANDILPVVVTKISKKFNIYAWRNKDLIIESDLGIIKIISTIKLKNTVKQDKFQ